MAEKVVSPGVFTNEIDASFLPAAVGDIGAAIIGPTVKGPAMVPTIVQTFADFENLFGTTFRSGSNYYQYLTSHAAEQYLQNGGPLTVIRISDATAATADIYKVDHANAFDTSYNAGQKSLTFETIGDGLVYNNFGGTGSYTDHSGSNTGTNNVLISGSSDNYRIEITGVNNAKGTFNVLVRAGNDTIKRKNVLESFNNVSLDPNTNNYIERVIGNQDMTLQGSGGTEPYIKPNGEFPNKSKFIRIKTVHSTTPNYLDENGKLTNADLSGSLPSAQSSSFVGALPGISDFDMFGNHLTGSSAPTRKANSAALFYDEIDSSNVQGIDPGGTGFNGAKTLYEDAINLLANSDEYDINLLMIPGVTIEGESALVQKAVDMCESRADAFFIADPSFYGKNVSQITGFADTIDTNYAAIYWPWVQVQDARLNGALRWVPPSVVLGGVYAFNDKVAHPWFAPAGLNRGGLDTVVQAERKLLLSQRDTLYDSNVNPIATFPGQGVTVFGQKTLQKKASALDRVNVRRLLIRVKKFIASSSRFLVFEQNNAQLRKRFLNIVNPFLEQVQSQSGLSAFRVVMDDTNNTPDTIDRNQLIGQIFLQPTRTAEFIILDFTIQPTGAAFPE
tara:strand:- start:88 stop:1941 length:1854 start_codon:yes stop_codon:yes gene_type:complete